jgi:hypothetical protein
MIYPFGTEFRFADKKWDNAPGGRVVQTYTDHIGVKYVDVEFKKSPGVIYTYYA